MSPSPSNFNGGRKDLQIPESGSSPVRAFEDAKGLSITSSSVTGHDFAACQGTRSESRSVPGHDFTGCGKTPSPEGYGLQPVHMPSKINAGFSPRGMLFGLFAQILAFFRSLFSRAVRDSKYQRALAPEDFSSLPSSKSLSLYAAFSKTKDLFFAMIAGQRPGKAILFASLLVLPLTGCRPHDFPQFAPNYREYAYVTNGGSGTVSIYDVINVRVDRELPVGQNPSFVTASDARNEVYVVNTGTPAGQGSVAIINAENNSLAGAIPVHKQPVALSLDPKGNFAYVVNSGSNSVSVLDLKARREITQIGVGEEPVAIRISPDGDTLAVANRSGNSVSIIDVAHRKVRAVLEGCPRANDIVILPDASKAFAACSGGHQVMAIALARTAGPTHPDIVSNPTDRLESLLDVGRGPVHLALKPDGGEIFVSNSLSDSISEIYAGSDEVGGAYIMGADPVRSIVSNDNALLYVGNLHSQEVTVYSIGDGKRAGFIHVGDGPSALAFSASGLLLFVVDSRSSDVAVVRTASNSLFTILPAGRSPNSIAVKAFNLP